MKNTRCSTYFGLRLSTETQRARVRRVLEHELTEKQRRAVIGYYFEGKTLQQLAQEYGVNPSTVWRTINRGLARMARCLRY